jgi:hypothetical protein
MKGLSVSGLLSRFRSAWAHAFSLEPPPLSPADEALLEKIAGRIVARKLEAAAIFALESLRGIAPIASAAAVVMAPLAEHAVPLAGRLAPFLRVIDTAEEYNRAAILLERRENVDTLIRKIEARLH